MRIKRLKLKDFGPFKRYNIFFVDEDEVCMLLTGKNNEGKSSIINALKLLNAATRVLNKTKQEIRIDGDYFYKLLQQDTENLLIGRMIHNYSNNTAEITGVFQGDLEITVYLDPIEDVVYAEHKGKIPDDIQNIFGFIPPLGPISESEDILAKLSYLKANIDTSLAPRHLRNYFYQLLSAEEMDIVRHLIKKSWQSIELLDYKVDWKQGKIFCFYKEDRAEREISWAGQGLQVWFQIITHLVRLRNASILILDEPEINLHPEKQNDLIRILKDYYHGSILIATHSVELMNNVNVSHIVNVQKRHDEPKIKSTDDRVYLDLVRSQIGSNFNLIASQFEDFDIIIFTEDIFDFSILQDMASAYKIKRKAFNIPIHGFSEFKKCIAYKDAYKLLIGKDIDYTVLLDRDYYPDEYLKEVVKTLGLSGIKVIFTPGKEIENLFLSPDLLAALIPEELKEEFSNNWDIVFESHRLDCLGSFITLHKQFLEPKVDMKTITTKYVPGFEKCWNCHGERHKIIDGKAALRVLRGFYRRATGQNLSQSLLVDNLIQAEDKNTRKFIEEVFCLEKTAN